LSISICLEVEVITPVWRWDVEDQCQWLSCRWGWVGMGSGAGPPYGSLRINKHILIHY